MDHASAPISSPPWISPARADAAEGLPLLAVRQRSAAVRHSRAHRHARGQLLGADEGLLSVEAGDSRWVVPAGHAVWIPPGVSHAARSHGPFAGWSLYVVPAACGLRGAAAGAVRRLPFGLAARGDGASGRLASDRARCAPATPGGGDVR
ncbi:MAG TPA: AraC family ligand binding domain-containing protein [Burkholderiaceae bacterium]|nr:AraC family ligand binding domain-containing protein [Burkholderiaceae bacterium]